MDELKRKATEVLKTGDRKKWRTGVMVSLNPDERNVLRELAKHHSIGNGALMRYLLYKEKARIEAETPGGNDGKVENSSD